MPETETTPPKRQRLSPEARRKQLLDTALELLFNGPFDEITVENVAAKAEVSKSLIFHYFPTIRDLQLAVLDVAANLLVDMLESALNDDESAGEQLARGVGVFIDFISLQPRSFDALASMAAADPQFNLAFQAVRDQAAQLAAGTFGDTTDTLDTYVLAGWVSFVETVVRSWVADPAGITREALVERVIGATEALAAHTGPTTDR